MKQIILIFSIMMASTIALAQQRSQEAFSMSIKTPSEVRAFNLVSNLSNKVSLTNEQKEELKELVRYYLDEYKLLIQRNTYEKELARLEDYVDKQAKKILRNEMNMQEFMYCMEDIKKIQGNGFGRR